MTTKHLGLAALAAALAIPAPLLSQQGHAEHQQKQEQQTQGEQKKPKKQKQESEKPKTTSSIDNRFLEEAAMGSMTEIEASRLAASKGSSERVKDFGNRMVQDHTKVLDQLRQFAQARNVTLPQQLDRKHQAEVDRLSKLSGDRFDNAYMRMISRDHQKDIQLYEKQARQGSDAELKTFASNTLTALRQHHEMAQNILKQETGAAERRK